MNNELIKKYIKFHILNFTSKVDIDVKIINEFRLNYNPNVKQIFINEQLEMKNFHELVKEKELYNIQKNLVNILQVPIIKEEKKDIFEYLEYDVDTSNIEEDIFSEYEYEYEYSEYDVDTSNIEEDTSSEYEYEYEYSEYDVDTSNIEEDIFSEYEYEYEYSEYDVDTSEEIQTTTKENDYDYDFNKTDSEFKSSEESIKQMSDILDVEKEEYSDYSDYSDYSYDSDYDFNSIGSLDLISIENDGKDTSDIFLNNIYNSHDSYYLESKDVNLNQIIELKSAGMESAIVGFYYNEPSSVFVEFEESYSSDYEYSSSDIDIEYSSTSEEYYDYDYEYSNVEEEIEINDLENSSEVEDIYSNSETEENKINTIIEFEEEIESTEDSEEIQKTIKENDYDYEYSTEIDYDKEYSSEEEVVEEQDTLDLSNITIYGSEYPYSIIQKQNIIISRNPNYFYDYSYDSDSETEENKINTIIEEKENYSFENMVEIVEIDKTYLNFIENDLQECLQESLKRPTKYIGLYIDPKIFINNNYLYVRIDKDCLSVDAQNKLKFSKIHFNIIECKNLLNINRLDDIILYNNVLISELKLLSNDIIVNCIDVPNIDVNLIKQNFYHIIFYASKNCNTDLYYNINKINKKYKNFNSLVANFKNIKIFDFYISNFIQIYFNEYFFLNKNIYLLNLQSKEYQKFIVKNIKQQQNLIKYMKKYKKHYYHFYNKNSMIFYKIQNKKTKKAIYLYIDKKAFKNLEINVNKIYNDFMFQISLLYNEYDSEFSESLYYNFYKIITKLEYYITILKLDE
jgi:hypothetical protein